MARELTFRFKGTRRVFRASGFAMGCARAGVLDGKAKNGGEWLESFALPAELVATCDKGRRVLAVAVEAYGMETEAGLAHLRAFVKSGAGTEGG